MAYRSAAKLRGAEHQVFELSFQTRWLEASKRETHVAQLSKVKAGKIKRGAADRQARNTQIKGSHLRDDAAGLVACAFLRGVVHSPLRLDALEGKKTYSAL